jgi:5-formyltetrahydrofolate cyclo-ligase
MKDRLRAEAQSVLRTAHADAGPKSGEWLADSFLQSIPWTNDMVIAGFAPMQGEPNPLPLLDRVAQSGATIALPAIVQLASALTFRRWLPGGPLVRGPHGTREPPPESDMLRPDLVLVPLLAFDRQGRRLGRGGGYYDRTLAALRAGGPVLAVGFAYAAQEIASVPAEAHDSHLDWIVTETGAIQANGQ